jgi:hypothetical protein
LILTEDPGFINYVIIRTIDEVLASFPAGEKIDIYPLMVRLSFEVALRSLLDMLLAARYEDTGEPMTEEALVGEVLVMLLAANDYFQAVINEAMRLYSPAWVADREAVTDDHYGCASVTTSRWRRCASFCGHSSAGSVFLLQARFPRCAPS